MDQLDYSLDKADKVLLALLEEDPVVYSEDLKNLMLIDFEAGYATLMNIEDNPSFAYLWIDAVSSKELRTKLANLKNNGIDALHRIAYCFDADKK